MTSTEGEFQLTGIKAYTKTWTPSGPIKAKLVYVHGYSEHINRYNDFFPVLAAKGIQTFSWDQRGWGRTASNKSDWGLTGPTTQVIADVAAFIEDKLAANKGADAVPLFVMGHSMGGGQVCTLLGDPQYQGLVSQVRGWLLESPFIGFTPGEEPSNIKIAVGRFVGRLLPHQQLKHELPPEHLTRVTEEVESFRNDPLCHMTGTLEGLAGLLDRTAALAAGTTRVGGNLRSLLTLHGTDDRTCSYDAAKKWTEQQEGVEDRAFKSYEGGFHQLHVDLCKDEYAADVIDWILKRSEDGAVVAPAAEAKL